MTSPARGTALPVLALSAFLAGLAHAAAFAPLNLWWLQPLALAALVWLACAPANATRGRAALAGLAFGFGWFVAGVAWLFVSMHRYGGMPAPMAAAALALFALYLGAFTGGSLALAAPALRRALVPAATPPSAHAALHAAMLFAACWGAGEMLRGWLFTGFPWLASGYAHSDGPLAGLAPIVGVHGIGALAAMVAAGLALGLASGRSLLRDRRPTGCALAAIVCVVAPLALGLALAPVNWAIETGEPVRVRLLQGNVPQQMKFDRARSLDTMQAYARAIAAAPAHLVVLPETAWTIPWSNTPPAIADSIVAALRSSGGIAVIGMPLAAATRRGVPTLSNSVAAIGGDGALGWRYDKRHLVPFGEFVPAGFGWFVRMMQIPLGDFGRGAANQPALELRGQRFAFNICYEDIFGEELAPQVRNGATVLVNISNIAWFGDSHALPQHLQISRMRSIELARPMLRATNTGMTAAIDSRGHIIAALPAYSESALAVELRGTTGMTPYARAGAFAPLGLMALLAATAFGLRARPGRRGAPR